MGKNFGNFAWERIIGKFLSIMDSSLYTGDPKQDTPDTFSKQMFDRFGIHQNNSLLTLLDKQITHTHNIYIHSYVVVTP